MQLNPIFSRRHTVALVFAICHFTLIGQDLLLNAGFEHHSTFSEYAKPHESNFDYLRNWDVLGLDVSNYCHSDLEEKRVKEFQTCANSIHPHGGKGMVKLLYVEACPEISRITGCASYIHSKLQSALVVGNIYEVIMWVYFPCQSGIDSSIFSNIGFYLSLEPERLGPHELFRTEYFFSDRIECESWIEIRKYIRALCPLQYITIGPFKDDYFPRLQRSVDVISTFYIDDVVIRQVNENDVAENVGVTPFCKYYEKRKAENILSESWDYDINFKVDDYILSNEDRIKLDSAFRHLNLNPSSVLVLSGHTDSTGNENLGLSQNRIESVKTYFKSRFNLGEQNFICFPMGSTVPKGSNMSREGRALNRRASVRLTSLKPSVVIYRNALEYLNLDEFGLATKELRKWISAAREEDKIQLLFDDRLRKLKNSSSWDFLVNEIRATNSRYRTHANAFFLDSLYFEDQKYRTNNPYLMTGYFPEFESQSHIARPKDPADYKYLDSINLESAKRFLIKNEFPRISEVGRRAVRGIANTMIHSQDSVVMKTYLPVIFEYCNLGEAEWESYAMLTDKLQIQRNLPQLYGTQWNVSRLSSNGEYLYPVDDIDSVNERRVKIGLERLPIK